MRTAQLPDWTNRLARSVALTAAFAVAAFGCGFGAQVFEWHPIGGSAIPGEQGAATLPARIGAPAAWTPDLEDAPIGAASILYSSNTWFPNGSDGLGALVGRGDDTYRVTGLSGPAGMGSVLSPDGARLASSDGIVDLATGEVSGWGPQWGDHVSVEPEAWSPDGRTVAVLAGDHLDPGLASDTTKLYLYDVSGGTPREVAELNRVVAMSGWTAAFSPDGTRLAYQNDGRLSVLTLAGATTADVPIPAGARLAGRGAWTRDGRNLLVTTGAPCDCGGHPMRWTVTAISATDGTATGTVYSRDGSYALRVLGWWPSGRPVAVEYTPVEGTEATIFDKPGPQYDLASQEQIKAARLIDLGAGTILTDGDEWGLAGDVESIDVADSVLARGEIRSGSAPLFDADGILVTVLGIVALALLILVFLGAWRSVATLTRRR